MLTALPAGDSVEPVELELAKNRKRLGNQEILPRERALAINLVLSGNHAAMDQFTGLPLSDFGSEMV